MVPRPTHSSLVHQTAASAPWSGSHSPTASTETSALQSACLRAPSHPSYSCQRPLPCEAAARPPRHPCPACVALPPPPAAQPHPRIDTQLKQVQRQAGVWRSDRGSSADHGSDHWPHTGPGGCLARLRTMSPTPVATAPGATCTGAPCVLLGWGLPADPPCSLHSSWQRTQNGTLRCPAAMPGNHRPLLHHGSVPPQATVSQVSGRGHTAGSSVAAATSASPAGGSTMHSSSAGASGEAPPGAAATAAAPSRGGAAAEAA